MNFIDIHCHILPGIDDGPSSLEESLKMIDIARQDGISTIFATPHVLDGLYDNTSPRIMAVVEDLRKNLPEGIELLYGADVRITPYLLKRIENCEVPTLNNSGYLLIELPDYVVPPNIDNLVYSLLRGGITPVLTHPERHLHLMRNLTLISELRETGLLCQITAMSITGDFGREIRKATFSMIKKGLADFVASDAHDSSRRVPVLSKAYKTVTKEFGSDIAGRLFFENPGKVLGAVQKGRQGRSVQGL